MEFEYWHLVFIPLLFLAGWLSRGLEQKQRSGSNSLPESYSRGLSLLIDEQTDKAIDIFIEVVRVDPDLIELQHVLGNLFRRRGEFERAIRLHRHLYNRADLSGEERARALKELAQDYLRAGVFDRAEAAFRRLSEVPSEYLYALKALLDIYITEHEWEAATETARLLETQAGEKHGKEIGHFYCERIDLALKRKNLEEADRLAKKALERADETPRVRLAAARVCLMVGALSEAIRLWRETAEKFPEFVPVFVGELADAMAAQGHRADAIQMLNDACEETKSIGAMEAALSRVAQWESLAAAERIAVKLLQEHPSLLAFNAFLQLKIKAEPENEEAKLMASLIGRHARRLSRYQCVKCGFLSTSFNWHCLGCGSWDSFPPRRIDDAKKG